MNPKEMAQIIVDAIDSKAEYRIVRRPYDDEFAQSWGITLEDIEKNRFIPCLQCGQDLVPRIILGSVKGKQNVYCSGECRSDHNSWRLIKLNEKTNVNQLAMDFIKHGLMIRNMDGVTRRSKPARHTILASIARTNEILLDILKELRDAKRT